MWPEDSDDENRQNPLPTFSLQSIWEGICTYFNENIFTAFSSDEKDIKKASEVIEFVDNEPIRSSLGLKGVPLSGQELGLKVTQTTSELSGYMDVNISIGAGVGVTGGVFLGTDGVHPYLGGGAMWGPGMSLTYSPDNVSTGWNAAFQLGKWRGGQVGISMKDRSTFKEVGFVTPGTSFTIYHVW